MHFCPAALHKLIYLRFNSRQIINHFQENENIENNVKKEIDQVYIKGNKVHA